MYKDREPHKLLACCDFQFSFPSFVCIRTHLNPQQKKRERERERQFKQSEEWMRYIPRHNSFNTLVNDLNSSDLYKLKSQIVHNQNTVKAIQLAAVAAVGLRKSIEADERPQTFPLSEITLGEFHDEAEARSHSDSL